MPGLRSWITWFVHAKVLQPYVLPERLSLPINFLYDTDLNVSCLLRGWAPPQAAWFPGCGCCAPALQSPHM